MNDHIEVDPSGRPVCFAGPAAVQVFALRALAAAIRFEVKTGMKLTRGPKASTIARRRYGLKGKPERLAEQVDEMIAAALQNVPVVTVTR